MTTNEFVYWTTNMVQQYTQQTAYQNSHYFVYGLGVGLVVACTALVFRIVRGAGGNLDL